MNNVYIGERYVPKIDGDWNPIKTYEPLIIVKYGNNTYTSKRYVPANNPPTTGDENDPYWFLSGNYNGAILNLQNRMSSLENDIDTLQQLPNFEKDFFNGKRIMIIGDSLTDPDTMPPNWVTLFKTYVEGLGGSVNIDFCEDGQSFAGIVSTSRYNDLAPYGDNFDIVIVALGVNDYQGQWGIGYYGETSLTPAVVNNINYSYNSIAAENLLLAKIRSIMPHALQYYCTPHRPKVTLGTDRNIPITMYRYAFSTVAMMYGARIIDLSSMPMFAPARLGNTFAGYTSNSDTLHPQPAYAPILMDYVKMQLLSGAANDWKHSSDRVELDLSTQLNAGTDKLNCIISSHGDITLTAYVSVNFTNAYVNVVDSLPLWMPGSPFSCMVNNKPTFCEVFNNALIVHMPDGETTATTLRIDYTFKSNRPTNDWYPIND